MPGKDDFLFGNDKHNDPTSIIVPNDPLGTGSSKLFIEDVPGASLTAIDISSPSDPCSSPFGGFGSSDPFGHDAFSNDPFSHDPFSNDPF